MAEKQYYTSAEIAIVVGFSERWVKKWRPKIVGAQKKSKCWRFDKQIVDARIRAGKDIRIGF